MSEGTSVVLPDTSIDLVLSTMRLFNGSQSKYCYSLSNSAVTAGAFFLVRAAIPPGKNIPYTPKNPDGYFRFEMIIDGDRWQEVRIASGDDQLYAYDAYVRAKGSKIDVCFARSTPDGDAPFVSGLTLRPLPDTLTSTVLMNEKNCFLVCLGHINYGVPLSWIRFPNDTLDRYWISDEVQDAYLISTQKAINMTADSLDQLPEEIFQTSWISLGEYFTLNLSTLGNDNVHHVVFHFSEIDSSVDTGFRVFSIFANGVLLTTEEPIDVFARVGANAAYSFGKTVTLDAGSSIVFNFTSLHESTLDPFLAAAELFALREIGALSPPLIITTVEAIKTTLGLSRYTGDPCLPVGYGYDWLHCSTNNTGITAISLSNYEANGTIPAELNNLTTLTEVYMNGNNLKGEIPNLSALELLEILDLSNNSLNGSIPSYLATLKNIKVLNLQNNNLSGTIPTSLLQRRQASSLSFEFSGNPHLCDPMSTQCAPSTETRQSQKSRTTIIVGISVAGILLLGVAVGFVTYFSHKKKKSSLHNGAIHKGLSEGKFAESKSSGISTDSMPFHKTLE
ncbi:hypothetical protein KP509_18G019600 [Ceratopteris richardii]|nr:hypothetical protein KP509_18G019600 [Ceratopteris richardii]